MHEAVIDLGSNTIRLSVYRCEGSSFETVFEQKEVAGLAGYIVEDCLEPEGIRKACDILCAFKEMAVRFVEEGNIHVFATASLRGINNQPEALEAIRNACGLLPEVLSGEEEARLDFIGASHFTECENGVMIDIGGASTELVLFENSQPIECVSIPIGCLSLYTKFVDKAIPTDKERKQMKSEVRDRFKDAIQWKEIENLPLMIGVGGTVRAAHKLSGALFGLPREQFETDSRYIKQILNGLKNNENHIYRSVYKRIPERTLTIYPGLIILNEAIRRFKCGRLFVSRFGVREGYLVDRVIKKLCS